MKCRVTLLPVVNDSVSSLTRFGFFKNFTLPAFYEIRRQSYPSTIGTPGNGVALSVGCFYFTQTALFKCLRLPTHRPSTLCRLKPQLQSTVVLREWPLTVASALAQVWSQVSQSRRTFWFHYTQSGTWNWSNLQVSGGSAGKIHQSFSKCSLLIMIL